MEFSGAILRMLGALGLVLACLMLTAYGFKRSGYWRRFAAASNPIEIVARRPIHARSQLLIVKIDRQYFLIGTSPQGIHRLGRLEQPTEKPLRADGTESP